jgi:hypothetical protein
LDLDIILGLEPPLQVSELLTSGDRFRCGQNPEAEAKKH